MYLWRSKEKGYAEGPTPTRSKFQFCDISLLTQRSLICKFSISSQVAYPYCAACFGRCYPNGGALITECPSLLDAVSQLPIRSGSGISSIDRKSSGGIERRQSGGIERKQTGGIERKQLEGIERRQSGGIERRQSIESAGTAASENGLVTNGPEPEVTSDAGTAAAGTGAHMQTYAPANA